MNHDIFMERFRLIMEKHLDTAIEASESLITKKIVNKFTYKYDIYNNTLYISIKIPFGFSYEYVNLPKYITSLTKSLNIELLIQSIDKYMKELNNLYLIKLARKHTNYTFMDYNVNEIYCYKII